MTELGEWLLTGLLNHGNSLLGATLFFAAFGIPLPATLLLMAAGAFSRQGFLPLEAAVIAAISGAVAGDACSYLLGRFSLRLVPPRILTAPAWQRASVLFARWGWWSVFMTRFLFTPVALPVNLLAGSTQYAWSRFMAAVVTGETVWVFLFGGLGHLFADQWEGISRLVGDVAGLLLGAVLLIAGVWMLADRHGRRRDDGK